MTTSGERRHTRLLVALGVVFCGAIACDRPGALLYLGADTSLSNALTAYCISLGADGQRRYGTRLSIKSYRLPQTLAVHPDGHSSVVARLDGIATSGLTTHSTSAAVRFTSSIDDQSLVLSACQSKASGNTLTLRAQGAIGANAMAAVRSGAEPAGAAELVAIGAMAGARYRYDGKSLISQPSSTLGGGAGSSIAGILSFDVDGDCADDLVLADDLPAVWRSATNGDVSADPSPFNASLPVRAEAAGDVDGDGYADLVLVGDNGGSLFLSDGARGFGGPTSAFDISPSNARAVALADLDGDGDLDAVIGFGGGPILWYQNDGSGRFTHMPALPGTFTTNQILPYDLNDDGRIDVLAATENGAPGLRVFLNQSGGTFTDVTATAVPSTLDPTAVAVLAADLDGDCHDEIVVLNGTQPPALLGWSGNALVSQGAGTIGSQAASAGVAEDLDGDGLADLALLSNGQIAVYSTTGGAQ